MNTLLRSVYVLIVLFISPWLQAAKLGESLPALQFDTQPFNFAFAPNGKHQLITVLLPSIESQKNGKFNKKVTQAGFCPLAIVDMQRRAWYAPQKTVEQEIEKEIDAAKASSSAKLGCRVSIDYDRRVQKAWDLGEGNTTIVVDPDGKIVFITEGVLDAEQEQAVLKLLASD